LQSDSAICVSTVRNVCTIKAPTPVKAEINPAPSPWLLTVLTVFVDRFAFDQVLISNHRKLLPSEATALSVVMSGHDFG